MPTVCRQGARGVFRQPLKDHPCSALPIQGTPFPGTPYSKPHPLGAHQDIRVSDEGGLSPHFTHLEMLFYFVIFKNTIECIKNKQTYFWRRTDSEAGRLSRARGPPPPLPTPLGPTPAPPPILSTPPHTAGFRVLYHPADEVRALEKNLLSHRSIRIKV